MIPVILAAAALLIALFGWLTVEVTDAYLHFWFGLGIIHRRVPIDRIAAVSELRTSWLYGWGIHLTSHGWIYNVSGFDAVEIVMLSGQRIMLGTDEPRELHAVLEQVLYRRSVSPPRS